MPRNHKAYLADIIDAIDRIEEMTKGSEYQDFKNDRMVQDAVVKNLLVIGEAVKNLPGKMKAGFDEVEWKKISGLRDVLIHAYFNIDNRIIWDVVRNKLEPLGKAVTGMMAQNKG
jgi:uncharacterized protein with HEPN domain